MATMADDAIVFALWRDFRHAQGSDMIDPIQRKVGRDFPGRVVRGQLWDIAEFVDAAGVDIRTAARFR
ncbi:hypothetical protein [Saccharopolyspora spinosa]|uniref:hypothetical protein n=1 Tax=Saccharopolyspora spinosa TaxID=60894 RepID=UPI001474B08B|nr:hypothetical protein [Saccharopolyspora spinosa]